MKVIKILFLLATLGITAISVIIYSGVVDVAADEPHGKFVYWLLEKTRENSIERSSADIIVPDLSDFELLLSGGSDYGVMCASCHLAPGQKESDMSLGLYPAPPNLSLTHDQRIKHSVDNKSSQARNFWIIKHGIKASGMPAWGKTHDDERIWAMVSFLERLPALTPEQYQILTALD
jgi:mono/diheme cytochrome c family protein|tara:strand:+ start:345 stop:875 length:531 start_codon:yes stop_codon:yes gene_type:complete